MAAKKSRKPKNRMQQPPKLNAVSDVLLEPIVVPEFRINLGLSGGKMEYCDGTAWQSLATENYVNTKTFDINTNTISQLSISRLGGFPTNASQYLRGDGLWVVPPNSGGTVTSVGVTGSTGLSVSGSPITSIGTISLTLDSDLQALSSLNTTGLVARMGEATYLPRTITAGTGIVVTNGNGVSGNPTVAVSSIDISTNTTGQIPISRLSGYPTSSNAFLRGDGTWVLPYINNLNINGNVSLGNYDLTTSGTIKGNTRRSCGKSLNKQMSSFGYS